MAQARHDNSRNTAINIRANRQQRDLIDQAARLLGKTRSDFMLESASRHAEDVLLGRALFLLDDDAHTRFQALLDDPPPPTDELRRLLSAKPPWD